jgi:hypothetical protein
MRTAFAAGVVAGLLGIAITAYVFLTPLLSR